MRDPLVRLAILIGLSLFGRIADEEVVPLPEGDDGSPEPVEALTSPPIVGRHYLVPCLAFNEGWIPVTGPRHEDADLPGGETPHHHADLRFAPAPLVRRLLSETVHDLCSLAGIEHAARCALFMVVSVPGVPELRPMPCLRKQPLHPGAKLTRTVEARLGDKARLTPDGRCPHQRIPLLSQPLLPREDGQLVRTCPGHGAQFDEQGRLVRRCPRREPS